MKEFVRSSAMKCIYAACLGVSAGVIMKKNSVPHITEMQSDVVASPDGILQAMIQLPKSTDTLSDKEKLKKLWQEKEEAYQKYFKEISLSDKPAEQANLLLSDFANTDSQAKLTALFRAWLGKNQSEATAWFLANQEKLSNSFVSKAWYEFVTAKNFKDVADIYIKGQAMPPEALNAFIAAAAQNGSFEDYTWLMKNFSPMIHEAGNDPMKMFFASGFPLEKKEEILKFENEPYFGNFFFTITNRLKDKPKEQQQWLTNFFDNEKISEKTKQQIANSYLRDNKNEFFIPIEKRIALLQKYSGLPVGQLSHQYAENQLATSVGNILLGQNDYAYQFRHGELSAQQVYDAVKNEMADFYGREKEFNAAVYHHLTEQNPEMAESLITGNEEDMTWAKINASRLCFNGCDPGIMNRLTEHVKTGSDKFSNGKDLGLKWSWEFKTQHYLDRYGDNYFTWLKSLPSGRNHTFAMEALIKMTKQNKPEIAQAVEEYMTQNK